MAKVNTAYLTEQPHAVVWNSVDFEVTKKTSRTNAGNTLPKLAFIGSKNFSWNGLDLLLGLAAEMVGRLEFVVIGACDDHKYTENVKVFPYLERQEMLKELADCDVGIGTCALFRKGLNECSTLKIRDYAVLGMPMVLPYKETAFVGCELPVWVLEISNTKSSLMNNGEKIVSFCEKWKGKSFPSKQAEQYFDSTIIEQKRMSFFEKLLSN